MEVSSEFLSTDGFADLYRPQQDYDFRSGWTCSFESIWSPTMEGAYRFEMWKISSIFFPFYELG